VRPFSPAIRSIASPERKNARTGLLCRRSIRFMATMMSLTTRVSRGRESGKPFPAWIDVDDLIECAALGRTEQVGQVDEVAVQIGDATVVAGAVASSRAASR
jgi:hypothetical protein